MDTTASTILKQTKMFDFLEALNPYAPTISAISAFVSTIMVIISTIFVIRKTRREKLDDLKFAIRLLCYEEERTWIIHDERPDFLEKLEHKFQKAKYKKLHGFALRELADEKTIEIISEYEAYQRGLISGPIVNKKN